MPEKAVDRREQIIKANCIGVTGGQVEFEWASALNSMDEYMKEVCLELLEYMAEHNVECIRDFELSDRVIAHAFKVNGEFISKEQLFENFL